MMALVNWMSSSCLKGGYLPSRSTFTKPCHMHARSQQNCHVVLLTCSFPSADNRSGHRPALRIVFSGRCGDPVVK